MNILKESYIPTFNECLVDSVILRNVRSFFEGKRAPSISIVLDTFSLAEAFVLFDRLISPHEWRVTGGLEKIDVLFLGDLSEAMTVKNDLTSFSVDYGIPNDEVFDYALNFCFSLDKNFSTHWRQLGAPSAGKDFSLEISDTLNIFHRAWKWKCNLVANPLWEMFFVSESTPTQPKELYDILSSDIRKEIETLQTMRYPVLMYIPPIPALALQECKGDISRFWSIVLKIRSEFSSCRKKYAHYQNVIANPDNMSLGELIQKRRDAISDVENELNQLPKKRTDGRVLMEIWDSFAKFEVGVGKEGEIGFTTGANIKSLVSKSLGRIRSWMVQGRARSLFNIYKKTLSIKGYDRLLQENFELPNKEIERQTKSLFNFVKDVEKATGKSPTENWADV